MITGLSLLAVSVFVLGSIHYADPHFWRDIFRRGER